jgi:two-component system chemotaxis response regulator CheB
VVVIGTSLGGLKAVGRLLSGLPADFPAPIVLVQHLSPRHPSRLPTILARSTHLKVVAAGQGDVLLPGHVYVATPDRHLVVRQDGTLHFSDAPPVRFSRPAADELFSSTALAFEDQVIAVILTGMGKDGADGVREIRRLGGVTIAQDEATSRAFSMPAAAIGTGCVDLVLPLDEIASALRTLTA